MLVADPFWQAVFSTVATFIMGLSAGGLFWLANGDREF